MISGLSARARAYIDRAKKHGVEFEAIEPEEIFERDFYVCMEYPGKPCTCCKLARTDVASTDPDFATLGHFPAMANGGPHTRGHVFTQRWECNQRQNNQVDTPTKAKIRRQKRMMEPREKREARGPKRKINSPGFRGSRLFGGGIRWKGRG